MRTYTGNYTGKWELRNHGEYNWWVVSSEYTGYSIGPERDIYASGLTERNARRICNMLNGDKEE